MSSMLERAIVDAQALKEAALKNAENLVIEKYATEVKDAVGRILEAEGDMGLGMEDPLGGGMEDPLGGEMEDPLGGEMEDPLPGTDDDDVGFDSTIENPESVARSLPDAFLADEDEIIRIKLDDLEAEFEDEDQEVGLFGGDDEFGEDEIGIDIQDLETDETSALDSQPGLDDDVDINISPEMVAEVLAEMGLDAAYGRDDDEDDEDDADDSGDDAQNEQTNSDEDVIDESEEEKEEEESQNESVEDVEIDLSELAEALRVDIDPQKSGWAGTPSSIVNEYENMILAREQDEEVKEENSALRKAVSKLQKENKNLGSAALKLEEQNREFHNVLKALQEKLESANISNAKLLYINQTLENASLNERQKRKIVEAISKAGSVSEAKMLHETLQETIGGNRNNDRPLGSLNEAVNRRSSLLTAGRKQKQTRDEANPLYNRMQKLAGIKI